MDTSLIRVLVVDDHPLLREGVVAVLAQADGIEVVGTCSDGLDALESTRDTRPDVVLLDLNIPALPGLEVNRRLQAMPTPPRVLVLTWHADEHTIQQLAAEGAAGFVTKDADPAVLARAIRVVRSGGTWFPKSLIGPWHGVLDPWDSLTAREREVAVLTAEGFSCADSGFRLGISGRTVEVHRSSVYRKLRIASATELVRYLMRRGLLGVG